MSHSFFAMKPQVPELSLYFSTCNCLHINRNWLLLACIELFICPMLRRLVLMAPPYCFVKSTLSAWNCHSHYKNVSRQEPLTSRLYSDVDMSVLLLTSPPQQGQRWGWGRSKVSIKNKHNTAFDLCVQTQRCADSLNRRNKRIPVFTKHALLTKHRGKPRARCFAATLACYVCWLCSCERVSLWPVTCHSYKKVWSRDKVTVNARPSFPQ